MKKLRISGALVIALFVLNPISADIPEVDYIQLEQFG